MSVAFGERFYERICILYLILKKTRGKLDCVLRIFNIKDVIQLFGENHDPFKL